MATGDEVLGQFTPPTVEEKKADTGRKLRIGIIGTGWIAAYHALAYQKMNDVEIVAAADLVPGKAEAFFENNAYVDLNRTEKVRCYKDHLSMLENETLDAVSVCTYTAQHARCIIDSLKRSVNVLVEKPLCVTTEEAIEIVKAEKESGLIVSVGFQPRYDPSMQMIKKVVDSGVLGKIYYIQTGGGRRRGIPNGTYIRKDTAGIGAIGDVGCYALDAVLNAIGYPKPITVTGYTSAYFGPNPKYNDPQQAKLFEVDDFAAGFVRLEGDIILDFRTAWAMHVNSPGDSIIMGTEGALRIPATDCWNGTTGGPLTIYHDVAGERVETVIPQKPYNTMIFDNKVRAFVEAVKYGLPAPIPTSQIFYNQVIISSIVESAKLGKEIKLDLPELFN
mgnify:CR=1 FL=1